MLVTRIRDVSLGMAVPSDLIGSGETAVTRTCTGEDSGYPSSSLDELQVELRTLAGAEDRTTIQTTLSTVIADLGAQANLVPKTLETTYIWLLVKLQALWHACAGSGDARGVVREVNSLATELADALAS